MLKFFNKIIYFQSLKSTNDHLISIYKNSHIKNNLCVVSDSQSKGRGRLRRKWFSDDNSLTFSLSVRLSNNLSAWKINMAVSLALTKVLQNESITSIIKYPNDIIVNQKKIAGILTDIILVKKVKWCIVGIGLNVNNQYFPEEISSAISMSQILSKSLNKNIILSDFLSELEYRLKFRDNLYRDYMLNLYGGKQFISSLYKGSFLSVKILNISDNGLLTVLIKNATIQIIKNEDIKFLL